MRPNTPPPPHPSIPVRVVDEDQGRDDPSYEAPVFYFFAVPRVGDAFYQVHRSGQLQYVVKEVAHVLDVEPVAGHPQVEHQVVIGSPVAPTRTIRPSRN